MPSREEKAMSAPNKSAIKKLPVWFFSGMSAVLLFASIALAQATPEGHWEGILKVESNEIGISLDLAQKAKSEWIASMGMPSENMTGLVVMDVKVKGNSVTFLAVELQMAKFELTLAPNGQMKGTIASPQGTIPIDFKRTGKAKVELIPASPAVAKEFEGDWEGSLQTPGRAIRMIFHFKNQPDNTVAATIDTPDTGGLGLPLNDVKQTGKQIEFGIKIAHGEFKGTLNQDATEIAGQLSHEQSTMPLTLKKK
jgi:hypothetical protein